VNRRTFGTLVAAAVATRVSADTRIDALFADEQSVVALMAEFFKRGSRDAEVAAALWIEGNTDGFCEVLGQGLESIARGRLP
jgi:hypothetical protein